MRKTYLIRHGRPDFPGGVRVCLGRSELPLGPVGRMQAFLLACELGGRVGEVYSSPLSRAVQTAGAFSLPVTVIDGLAEQYAGEWDGLTFTEIRTRYPELSARRAAERYLPLPGSEPDGEALSRFTRAMDGILSCGAPAAVVAHASVIRLYLDSLGAGMVKIPYGSYVELDGGRPVRIGVLPHPEPDDSLCLGLLRAAGTPERVISHCAAAADRASELAGALGMDVKAVRAAAYLHDIARTQPHHAETGAEWLSGLGYVGTAELVRLHHGHDGKTLDSAAVVYLADKLVLEDRPCTLAERFAASESRCASPQALKKHGERRAAAENIVRLMEGKGVRI